MDRVLTKPLVSRRSLLAVPLVLPFAGKAFAADAAPLLPILPLRTDFSFWEHHWHAPLPDHPLYESVDAAVSGALVRLWLTERASKRVTAYINDADIARIAGAQYAAIQANRSGAAGTPQSLTLSGPISWEVRFGAGASDAPFVLRQASTGSALAFCYANAGVTTPDAMLTLSGKQYRAPATYAAGAYAVALPYGAADIAPSADGFRAGDLAFTKSAGRYTARFTAWGQPSSIELRVAADNALLAYRHSHGRRTLALDFDGALSISGRAVGFDLEADGKDIASGTLTPSEANSNLTWDFSEPDWARKPGLLTSLTPRTGGAYGMRIAQR